MSLDNITMQEGSFITHEVDEWFPGVLLRVGEGVERGGEVTTTEALFDDTPYVEYFNLAERFGVPPFSVLDTRSGLWHGRRAVWDHLELDSTSGRDDALTFAKARGTDPISLELAARVGASSMFDPVLTELIYRWWSPANAVVLDPFAGGSVRGVVAGVLGREYHGVDLSTEQIDANEATADRLTDRLAPRPRWYHHDAATWQPDIQADLIISCPPYGTLERYSDHPKDLSTMKWADFIDPYRTAIERSVTRLKDDRFAVFVVGNYREDGRLRNLVGLTVNAFDRAGATYYGDLVLLNSAATAGIRGSATFNAGRKPVSIHQQVCVFVKGDWHKAAAAAERIDPLDDEFEGSAK